MTAISAAYNPWPLGKLPVEFRRSEPELIKEGYPWQDPREIVDIFERKVARFAGAPYAVAVDSCSNALFLALTWWRQHNAHSPQLTVPRHTYVSVPQQVHRAGFKVAWIDDEWTGAYQLNPSPIVDAAVRWTRGMYWPGTLWCVSFQIKKRVPIGKGGMILTDNLAAADWLRLATYDGRDLSTPYDSQGHVRMLGYHMYMTPEDAARGIWLMDRVPETNDDSGSWRNYPDASAMLQGLL